MATDNFVVLTHHLKPVGLQPHCFNKKKQPGIQEIIIGDKTLVKATV